MIAAVVCVAGATATSAAPRPASTVLAWGDNQQGELGDGSTTGSSLPVPVHLPAGTRVTAIAAGYFHGLALTAGGGLLAWGSNFFGELGDGSTTQSSTPISVAIPAGDRVTAVAAGFFHNLALTHDGRVLAWGGNQDGELGDGTTVNRATPVPVSLPVGVHVRAVGAGSFHSLAVTAGGHVLAWGSNDLGQLGNGNTPNGSPTPVFVHLPNGTHVIAVAGGDDYSLALTADGRVFAWGFNGQGQLGDGTTTTSTVPVQVHLPARTRVTAIAAGGDDSLAVTSDGRALAWGINDEGQLGDGSTSNRSVPVFVQLPAGTRVTGIAGGDFHTVAVTASGRLLAWGGNSEGQLGNGTATDSSVPVAVDLPASDRASAVAARGNFSLALATPVCPPPPCPHPTSTATATATPTPRPTPPPAPALSRADAARAAAAVSGEPDAARLSAGTGAFAGPRRGTDAAPACRDAGVSAARPGAVTAPACRDADRLLRRAVRRAARRLRCGAPGEHRSRTLKQRCEQGEHGESRRRAKPDAGRRHVFVRRRHGVPGADRLCRPRKPRRQRDYPSPCPD